MAQITLDISTAAIEDIDIERQGEDEVRFDVSGVVTNIDNDKLHQALTAKNVEPISLTIETGYDEDSASD